MRTITETQVEIRHEDWPASELVLVRTATRVYGTRFAVGTSREQIMLSLQEPGEFMPYDEGSGGFMHGRSLWAQLEPAKTLCQVFTENK